MKVENRNSPRSLTFEQAIEVWSRYWDGEYQHRIAASYDVNPGRVNEVVKRHKHIGSEEIAAAKRDRPIH